MSCTWTAGHYNRFILRKVFASGKEMPSFGIQCLLTVTVTLLGAGLFSVVFNLCNELQVWNLGLHLPAAFCIPAPVYPNGEQLF
ncbi:hypothetical protein NXW75_09485 [Bacteroides xylanisolvens]|nr:hypothetical protein [Bacteroides xylanisolvens]